MDLLGDEEAASELAAVAEDHHFESFLHLARKLRASRGDSMNWSPRRQRRLEQFHRRLADINAEASALTGQALLSKVETKLEQVGWRPLGDGLALEDGGGEGFFLPAFSSRFANVVFVDASLVNVVLAAKAAAELKLTNVACVRADVMALPFRSGIFDFVHQNGVVEHVDDPARMVREGTRVRDNSGYYVCVSPNRMGITPEPHFGLPGYGFIPPPLRRRLIPLVRGFAYEDAATEPRSLRQLRRFLRGTGNDETIIYFLPRGLPFTARQTTVRRFIRAALSNRVTSSITDYVLNVALLPVAPVHTAISRARGGTTPAGPASSA